MVVTRSDRRAMSVIAVIIATVVATIVIERFVLDPKPFTTTLDSLTMDSMQFILNQYTVNDTTEFSNKQDNRFASKTYYDTPHRNIETINFDPNTADSITLLRLGLAPWQVRAIYKYRAKGGRYHRVQDFQRVPGMTPEIYNRLAPHITIGQAFQYYSDLNAKNNTEKHDASHHIGDTMLNVSNDTSRHTHYARQEKFRELVTLDLNTVDTATLKKVPGIASYRARRIVEYRQRLGGFISVDQLDDISEDIPSELKVWFTVRAPIQNALNINQADIRTLSRHPYVSYAQARAIMNYRKLYGNITSLSQLSLLEEFTDEDLLRLKPYVTF